jgi:hypothetical protein
MKASSVKVDANVIQRKVTRYESVKDLSRYFRYRQCRTKGDVAIEGLWAVGWDQFASPRRRRQTERASGCPPSRLVPISTYISNSYLTAAGASVTTFQYTDRYTL